MCHMLEWRYAPLPHAGQRYGIRLEQFEPVTRVRTHNYEMQTRTLYDYGDAYHILTSVTGTIRLQNDGATGPDFWMTHARTQTHRAN